MGKEEGEACDARACTEGILPEDDCENWVYEFEINVGEKVVPVSAELRGVGRSVAHSYDLRSTTGEVKCQSIQCPIMYLLLLSLL